MAVTAFTDFYIGIMTRGGHMTQAMIGGRQAGILHQLLQEFAIIELAKVSIYFRQFFFKVSEIPL